MKHNIYSMYDSKTLQYRPLNMFLNDGVAERAVSELFQGEANDYTKYPEDFTLMHLGTFDDETGSIELGDTIRPVVHLWELRSKLVQQAKAAQAELGSDDSLN